MKNFPAWSVWVSVITLMPLGATEEGGGVKAEPKQRAYPEGVREVKFLSGGDGTEQPALFWAPGGEDPVPLLVALHTWSGNYRQRGGEVVYAEWCQFQDWAFLHPDFRGPNRTPEAMGSDLVIADIAAAVAWAKEHRAIDSSRVYAVGVSGGGHAAMLAAARLPELWAAVSAWCGISDIDAWHRQTRDAGRDRYARDIEMAIEAPVGSEVWRRETRDRSPVSWLGEPRTFPLDIWHGIEDGRSGSVPFTHALHAWNATAKPTERFPEEEIEAYYRDKVPPGSWSRFVVEPDADSADRRVPLLRRVSGQTRLTLFDGGHEIDHVRALGWLAEQKKGRPPRWEVGRVASFRAELGDGQSGR